MILKYFKPAINYSSWADRFSSFWTFLLLLVLAAITAWRHYSGPNVSCYTPKYFTPQMIDYVNDRCWTARQMNVYYPERLYEYAIISDEHYSRRKESTRTLYQWLPVIIACMALFFRFPDIVLRIADSLIGYGSTKVHGLVRGYKRMSSVDRVALSREMANYFNEIFSSRPLKSLGVMVLILIFAKILFFVNSITQLILLDGYLSPSNVTSYGQHIVESINSRNYSEIQSSPSFPREILCYVNLNRYQLHLNHTVQCSVPVNVFNEQVCFFVWVWLLIVCVAAGLSLIVFIIRMLVPVFRQKFIEKYLKMALLAPTNSQLASFTNSVIGNDGVLLLQLLAEISSDVLVRDIVVKIWYIHYLPEPNSKSQGVQYPEKSSGYKI